MSTIKHILSTHEITNEKARENTRRKPDQLNDRPLLRRKPTEGQVQRI